LVPGEALGQIVNLREERFDSEARAMIESTQPIFGVPAMQSERSLECPCCSNGMDVINYAGDSGVSVDRCPCCQTVWLDEHELENVQILMERWEDEAPETLKRVADQLENARQDAVRGTEGAFCGSRLSFVNALINRLLDAA
jgi:Zn-finger nucleic acid-binding protein